MSDSVTTRCAYLSHAFRPPEVIIEQARKHLKGVKYDTLAGTGLSGALVVPLLARAFDKHWLIVRKPGDSSHSSRIAEGVLGSRWVFVDDLIDSGETRERVIAAVNRLATNANFSTVHVGDYLYESFGSPEFRKSAPRL